MKGIKEYICIGTLVVIFIMMPRGTECYPDVAATNSCISLNERYLPALTNNLSPEYVKTSEELKNQISDAGYYPYFDIKFYEDYDGKVLAHVRIGKADGIEEELKKAGVNVLSMNNTCDCELRKQCEKWSEPYPCRQDRCILNLCNPRNCRPDTQMLEVNSTGNSITKKADDCPTRPMTNITNRDPNGEDKNPNTHGADNSWTTPKTNTSNTDQNCPGPKDCLVDIIIAVSITITVLMAIPIVLIVTVCIWCVKNNRRGDHQSYRNPYFSMAFDRIDHSFLIEILDSPGIPEFIRKWIYSFLSQRFSGRE